MHLEHVDFRAPQVPVSVPPVVGATRRPASELPLRYSDGDSVLAFFAVNRGAAEAKIDTRRYRLGMHWGKFAIVGMGFYEFRASTLGAYHEVGIAVPVVPRACAAPRGDMASLVEMLRQAPKRRNGLHVLHLPVTTEPARAAGWDHWGYPKFVTAIEWSLKGRVFDCEVRDPAVTSQRIVSLRGRLGRGLPCPPLDQVLYSDHDDQMLRTEITMGGRTTVQAGLGLRLDVGTSPHPMAQSLRDLGLHDARPLLVMQIRALTSHLPAGVAV